MTMHSNVKFFLLMAMINVSDLGGRPFWRLMFNLAYSLEGDDIRIYSVRPLPLLGKAFVKGIFWLCLVFCLGAASVIMAFLGKYPKLRENSGGGIFVDYSLPVVMGVRILPAQVLLALAIVRADWLFRPDSLFWARLILTAVLAIWLLFNMLARLVNIFLGRVDS